MGDSASAKPILDTQLFRDAFNASPIGIAVENLDGQPLFVNPAFCRFLGFTEEELRRKHCVDFSPKEDAEKDWTLFQQLRAGSIDHYQLEKRYFRQDGSLVWGRLSLSLLNNRQSPLVIAMVEDITDKKRAEESLREGEERLRLAAQAGRMFAYSWDAATDLIERSGASSEILGVGKEQVPTGASVSAMIHPDDREKVEAAMVKLTVENPILRISYRIIRPDGAVAWLERNSRAHFDAESKLTRVVGMIADITDRKRAEQELSNANERLRLALEAGSAGGWEYDLRTGKNVWFGTAHEQLGMTPDETEGSREEFWDRVHEDDRERVQHALQVAREKHEEYADDFRVVWRNGTTHWLRSRGRFQYDGNGEAERLLGISLDITEYKLAEEALLRYAAIVESSEDGIASVTRDGIIVTWNAGAQRMFGYTQNEAVGKPANIIVPPELRDQQKKILETLWAGGRIEQFESVRVSKTGRRIDVSLSVSPVKDSTGKIVGCAGIARDISTRKRAEQDLLSSEQRYRLLFERNLAGVAIASADARLLDCNDGWAHILGYESKDELLGRHASEFYFNPAERKPLVDELFEKHILFSRELHLRRKDGTSVWVLFNAAVHSERDTPIVQCTMIDISEWKKAEEALSGMTRKLIESQEQERRRIGRELHDDINQRLAMLAIELEQLESDPSDVQSRVQELRKQMGELSNDVQALSHELHSSKLEYLGVVSGIKSWCKEFGERQKMEIDFKSDVSSVLPFDIGIGLFRVLQESLQNAVKHSGVKRIEVELREVSNEIHLIVSDLGRGFDVEAALQGKGLGLTSMRERVRLVNGTISIESKPMSGTTIHVRVPLESARVPPKTA